MLGLKLNHVSKSGPWSFTDTHCPYSRYTWPYKQVMIWNKSTEGLTQRLFTANYRNDIFCIPLSKLWERWQFIFIGALLFYVIFLTTLSTMQNNQFSGQSLRIMAVCHNIIVLMFWVVTWLIERTRWFALYIDRKASKCLCLVGYCQSRFFFI